MSEYYKVIGEGALQLTLWERTIPGKPWRQVAAPISLQKELGEETCLPHPEI